MVTLFAMSFFIFNITAADVRIEVARHIYMSFFSAICQYIK